MKQTLKSLIFFFMFANPLVQTHLWLKTHTLMRQLRPSYHSLKFRFLLQYGFRKTILRDLEARQLEEIQSSSYFGSSHPNNRQPIKGYTLALHCLVRGRKLFIYIVQSGCNKIGSWITLELSDSVWGSDSATIFD